MCIQNERGFTLIESLLHCFLFAIVTFLLATLVVVCMNVPSTTDVFADTEFEVVSFDVNNLLLEDVQQVKYSSSTSVLVTLEGDKGMFSISAKEPFLYRAKGVGFEPLIGTIREGTSWEVEPELLNLKIVTTDGYEKEREFYVPTLLQ